MSKMDALVKNMGQKNTEIFLETLAKDKQFKNAIETPLGVEILSTVTQKMELLIETVLRNEDDVMTRAEIKCYRSIVKEWSAKINSADQRQVKFNTITEGA